MGADRLPLTEDQYKAMDGRHQNPLRTEKDRAEFREMRDQWDEEGRLPEGFSDEEISRMHAKAVAEITKRLHEKVEELLSKIGVGQAGNEDITRTVELISDLRQDGCINEETYDEVYHKVKLYFVPGAQSEV